MFERRETSSSGNRNKHTIDSKTWRTWQISSSLWNVIALYLTPWLFLSFASVLIHNSDFQLIFFFLPWKIKVFDELFAPECRSCLPCNKDATYGISTLKFCNLISPESKLLLQNIQIMIETNLRRFRVEQEFGFAVKKVEWMKIVISIDLNVVSAMEKFLDSIKYFFIRKIVFKNRFSSWHFLFLTRFMNFFKAKTWLQVTTGLDFAM